MNITMNKGIVSKMPLFETKDERANA